MQDKCYVFGHGTSEDMAYHYAYCPDECWLERLKLIKEDKWSFAWKTEE